MQYRNATFAFVNELGMVRRRGVPVVVRGQPTHELLARSVTLDKPTERFITVPGRRNDVFATVAETMWVVAGRSDMEYLRRYLPRAPMFSDDGVSWRGGYGPRLRDWSGVDQIDEVRRQLLRDPTTRRAVAVLFDPAQDYADSRDIPCNNWLHFLIRDGKLQLNIAVRSNDILWGFSGINTFEWSVLQEMMAYWLGVEVGSCTFSISSLHLYDNREEQADRTLRGFAGYSGYEQGWAPAKFATSWQDFPAVLERWFDIEAKLASGRNADAQIDAFPDPLLRQFLQALAIKWSELSQAEVKARLLALGKSDIVFGLHEQLLRDSRELLEGETSIDGEELRSLISRLHRSKDASYGNAWKRRGELISIASNLARKVDRIESVAHGAPSGSESLLDTAIDLFVYAVKYETYLADQDEKVAEQLFGEEVSGASDGPDGFNRLLSTVTFNLDHVAVATEATNTVESFESLDQVLQTNGGAAPLLKLQLAGRLTTQALRLVLAVVEEDWAGFASFRAEVEAL